MAPSFSEHDRPRSMDQALADLRVTYEKRPTRALAHMIEQLEREIATRKATLPATPRPT